MSDRALLIKHIEAEPAAIRTITYLACRNGINAAFEMLCSESVSALPQSTLTALSRGFAVS